MINAIHWFKDKGFTFNDKITIHDLLVLQADARDQGLRDAGAVIETLEIPKKMRGQERGEYFRGGMRAAFIAIEKKRTDMPWPARAVAVTDGKLNEERACERCGCTDTHACVSGCSWVRGVNICTACLTLSEEPLYWEIIEAVNAATTKKQKAMTQSRLEFFGKLISIPTKKK